MRKSVLIVEDNWLLAEMMENEVRGLGIDVVGPTNNIHEAADLASSVALIGALLDIELQGARVFPVCEILDRRRIPFAFVTGHRQVNRSRWQAAEMLFKPFAMADLYRVVRHFVELDPQESEVR